MSELYRTKFYYLFSGGKVVDGPFFTYPEAVKARSKFDPYLTEAYKIYQSEVELKSVD
jgi:hypothetical protein